MIGRGIGALAAIVLAACLLGNVGTLSSDFDGDASCDSLTIGGLGIHLFWTGENASDEGRPVGANGQSILREALLHNDFVFDFLNRTDPAEVARVRKAALEIVGRRDRSAEGRTTRLARPQLGFQRRARRS